MKRTVPGLSSWSGRWWYEENGEGGVPASFLQRWEGWGGKRMSPLDSPMPKTGVVRSLWRWVGGRGKNRVERLGIGMWRRRTTTGASGAWRILDSYSPTQKMGGTQKLGGWEG